MKDRLLAGRNAWRWLWPLSVALVVRAVRGYRGFPAIDEFAYVPLARATLDSTLYRGDWVLQGFTMHSPIWALVVGAADRTIGVANGLWLATVALTIATVFAAARLLRTAGVPAYVLPIFIALGFIGRVQGIGRGAFDGALGAGFHAQWLAICLLLWTYDAFARRRPVLTGVLLGLATLAHLVVGVHGAFALAIASLVARDRAFRDLAITALACAIISAPVTVPMLLELRDAAPASVPVRELIQSVFLFRAPHHYTLGDVSTPTKVVMVLLAIGGFAAAAAVRSGKYFTAHRRLAKVFAGHTVLLAASAALAAALNAPQPSSWALATTLPYQLDLTRTTPLVVVLSVLLMLAACWNGSAKDESPSRRTTWLACSVALASLVLLAVDWHIVLLLLIALAVGMAVLRVNYRTPMVALTLGAVAMTALFFSARDRRTAPAPTSETAALYAWAGDSTARDALFIVPPGFRAFRLLAGRPVYADFEMFPITSAAAGLEWRQRLELIAAPDAFTAEQRGWIPGVPLWDRSYAVRNTPTRIASLLRTTGARYFVWDSLAAEVPPYVPLDRAPDAEVRVAYANARFTVYERAGADTLMQR